MHLKQGVLFLAGQEIRECYVFISDVMVFQEIIYAQISMLIANFTIILHFRREPLTNYGQL